MSEKITNATTIESTTATTVAKTVETTPSKKSSSTTTSKKGDTAMKSANKSTTAAATATTMTAQEFKQKSYDAYLSYVSFIEGNLSIEATVESLSPIMSAYGFSLTVDNLANTLTVKMTAFGKDKGEQAKKVKSISTFRAFIKEGWKAVVAAPVHSNAGKNPADAKTTEQG